MFESIGDVLQIMVSRDWETFRSDLVSRPTSFRHIASAVSACSQLNGMTLLHAAVRHDPPLDIVAKMIEICPHMTASKDCLGRTPLHVAAGSGCSAALLHMIARAHPAACDAQDEEGKTPLHFVCDSSCVLFEDDLDNDKNNNGGTPRQPPKHDAVSTLLCHSSIAATLEDDEGMSPLEHAIMSHASLTTVKLLLRSVMGSGVSGSTSPRPAKKIRRISFDDTSY